MTNPWITILKIHGRKLFTHFPFFFKGKLFQAKVEMILIQCKQSQPWYPNHEIKKIHNLSLGPWVVTLHLSFCFFQTKLKWCQQCKNENPKKSKYETYANHPIWTMITNNNSNGESWKKKQYTHTHTQHTKNKKQTPMLKRKVQILSFFIVICNF